MNDDLERIWKEAVGTQFVALSRYLLWRDWEKPRKACQDSRTPGRDLSPGPPEYEAGVPIIQPLHSVMYLGTVTTFLNIKMPFVVYPMMLQIDIYKQGEREKRVDRKKDGNKETN
jgi:hypothetical protein